MPLLDHFHPPLIETRAWESFQIMWVAALVERLNGGLLPPRCLARAAVHFGRTPTDVPVILGASEPSPGWQPPPAARVVPITFTDVAEVRVISTRAGPELVAAVELVSPSNKDRPDSRRLFAAKCAAYLAAGVGLVVVDTVTERLANLHDEVLRQLGRAGGAGAFAQQPIYAKAYRPSDRDESDGTVEVWEEPLAVGRPLPVMPLALRDLVCVPLDLEASYSDARRRSLL